MIYTSPNLFFVISNICKNLNIVKYFTVKLKNFVEHNYSLINCSKRQKVKKDTVSFFHDQKNIFWRREKSFR